MAINTKKQQDMKAKIKEQKKAVTSLEREHKRTTKAAEASAGRLGKAKATLARMEEKLAAA